MSCNASIVTVVFIRRDILGDICGDVVEPTQNQYHCK